MTLAPVLHSRHELSARQQYHTRTPTLTTPQTTAFRQRHNNTYAHTRAARELWTLGYCAALRNTYTHTATLRPAQSSNSSLRQCGDLAKRKEHSKCHFEVQ